MSVTDRFRLDGRTAILTGVGPGVGEHVAKAYAELGANVVISARSGDRLERIAAEINAADGGRALAVTADAGEKAELVNLVSQAREAFGPIDRKSVVKGTRVSVSVDLGGRSFIKKQTKP